MTIQASNPFPRNHRGIQDVPSEAFAITPSDTDQLAQLVRAIYVGTGGDLTVKFMDAAAAITFVAVPDGAIIPGRIEQVMATDTDASDLVGLV